MDHIDLLRRGDVVMRLKVLSRAGQVIKIPDFLPRIDLGEATTHRGRQFGTVCPGRQDLPRGNLLLLRFGPLYPRKRKSDVAEPMSVMCQKQTHRYSRTIGLRY